MGFRLPPVNALRLFEAAARLESFKLAAQEIHITPSAVSHGIRTLEEWVGIELFRRGPKGLRLTEQGIAYAEDVRRALAILSTATESISVRHNAGILSVGAPAPFANYWLLPRLATFTTRYPDIQVNLQTIASEGISELHRHDVTIQVGANPGQMGSWVQLMQQAMVPVCAPEFLMHPHNVTDPRLISRGPLIQCASDAEDWKAWYEAKGLEPQKPHRSVVVDSEQLALEAAVQGLGITLGRCPLVNNYLNSGELIEVCGPPIVMDRHYWLVANWSLPDRPDVKPFHSWLINEARHSPVYGGGSGAELIPPRPDTVHLGARLPAA